MAFFSPLSCSFDSLFLFPVGAVTNPDKLSGSEQYTFSIFKYCGSGVEVTTQQLRALTVFAGRPGLCSKHPHQVAEGSLYFQFQRSTILFRVLQVKNAK